MIVRDSSSRFINVSSFTHEESCTYSQRGGIDPTHLDKISKPLKDVTKDDVLRIEPMTPWQEFCCIAFLSFVGPGSIIIIPLLTALIGYFVAGDVVLAFRTVAIALSPFIFLSQAFSPKALQSWITHMMYKYFSYRIIFGEGTTLTIQEDVGRLIEATEKARPQIFVAPPHGVYPYGSILTILIWPVLTGHHLFGLSASAALRVPIMRQVLQAIGCIHAGRRYARHALEHWPYTIGISTGGVAEVFETNSKDACILLKERIGLIKLAIRTGADLVPVYTFGNTELLSCWLGEGVPHGRQTMEWFSRKVLGFAAIPIFGRFLIPIPHRKPVLCVFGNAIPTYQMQSEDPTTEQVHQVQELLIRGMQATFDKYKALYGAEDAKLIIK